MAVQESETLVDLLDRDVRAAADDRVTRALMGASEVFDLSAWDDLAELAEAERMTADYLARHGCGWDRL